jgi:hypothetical protein
MKTIFLFLVLAVLIGAAGCSSEPSNNPNPRRMFNGDSGGFEGPSPMPAAKGDQTKRY